MEEGDMRALKSTIENKAKRKMEQSYEGIERVTILPSSKGETDLSREEFRETL